MVVTGPAYFVKGHNNALVIDHRKLDKVTDTGQTSFVNPAGLWSGGKAGLGIIPNQHLHRKGLKIPGYGI
jgi:hypothetical protein